MKTDINAYRERGLKLKRIRHINEMCLNEDFVMAINEASKFLDDYGLDSQVIYYYGLSLRKLGYLKEAISVLEDIRIKCEQWSMMPFYVDSKVELFKAYFMNNDFEKAYKLLGLAEEHLKNEEYYCMDKIRDVIEIKLGLNTSGSDNGKFELQMINYSKEDGLMHVREHTIEHRVESNNSLFADNIDIESLFDIATKAVETAKPLPLFAARDSYYFKYPNIGINSEDVFKVVTNKGTNEIISMYPVQELGRFAPFVNNNLFDMYNLQQKPKTKQLSQIEKFKNRALRTQNLKQKEGK